jgi:hypothetical protein
MALGVLEEIGAGLDIRGNGEVSKALVDGVDGEPQQPSQPEAVDAALHAGPGTRRVGEHALVNHNLLPKRCLVHHEIGQRVVEAMACTVHPTVETGPRAVGGAARLLGIAARHCYTAARSVRLLGTERPIAARPALAYCMSSWK